MKIGITERGDAGLDLSWFNKLEGLDGAILITKNITNGFAKRVLGRLPCPVSIHATCTGWGGSVMEPCVPDFRIQLRGVQKLIESGFPADRIVLRVDPIFPTPEGLDRAKAVLEEAYAMGLLPRLRVRVSVFDEYPHVRERFKAAGIEIPYGNSFYASPAQFQAVTDMLSGFPGQKYECCAERTLTAPCFVHTGCVGKTDLERMGLPVPDLPLNPQNRSGCLCMACKKELLTRRHPCGHRCAYCFWKD